MLGFGALGEFALGEGPTEGMPFNNVSNNPIIVPRRKYSSPPGIGLNPNLFKNNFPNNQYHYPAPRRIRRSGFDLSVGFTNQLRLNPYPTRNDIPTSFRVPDFPIATQIYNPNLYSVVVVSVPIANTDSSRPFRIRETPPDQSVALNPNINDNPFPFNTYDFSVPRKVPFLSPVSDPLNLNLYTVVVTVLPFNTYDFTKPFFPRATTVLPDTLNINLFTNAFPFNQFDYSHPTRVPQAPVKLPDGLNPNINTNPLPFSASAVGRSFRQQPAIAPASGFNPNLSVVIVAAPVVNFASTIIYHFRLTPPDQSVGFLIQRTVTPPAGPKLLQRTLTGVGL